MDMTDLGQALKDFEKVSGGPYMSKQENLRLKETQEKNRADEEMRDKQARQQRVDYWSSQINRRGAKQGNRTRQMASDPQGLPLGQRPKMSKDEELKRPSTEL